jgi:nucleotide-binding universal stress UspA family protein
MTRIVVGMDGSAHADRALRWAVREAQLRAAAIELVHGYVVHLHTAMLGRTDREMAAALMDTITEHNRSLLDSVEWDATLVPLITGPSSAVLDVGQDADLIVVGSRGLGGFGELFLGATSFRTAAHASAPVAVIRGDDDSAALDGRRAIVVGVDDSRAGRRALHWALDEAGRRDVGVTVVHGYHVAAHPALATVGAPEQLEHLRTSAHDHAADLVDRVLVETDAGTAVVVDRVITPGPPARVLLDTAGADRLLVVGTHGRGALGRVLIGSVSHQILHHATGPVVVVP